MARAVNEAGETPKERRDRELGELLQEMRVAITGVQVLFAFLLTMPFSQRFTELSAGERRVYLLATVTTALASLLLIAPAANHRLLFREGIKEQLLRAANRLVIAGLILLALSVCLCVFLAVEVVYSNTMAAYVAGGVVLLTAFAWFVFPLILKVEEDDD